MTQLIVQVKQGEDINVPFTIKQDGVAMDLSGASVRFIVKRAPQSTSAIFTKTITASTDPETVGQITEPAQGKFEVRLTEAETNITATDYSLVIFLDYNNQKDIISSDDCNGAIYRVCTQ